jgi:hypothetical protein
MNTKEKQYKAIPRNELVVGEIYFDTQGMLQEQLKLVKIDVDENKLYFEAMAKNTWYHNHKKDNGLIDYPLVDEDVDENGDNDPFYQEINQTED